MDKWSVIIIGNTQMANLVCIGTNEDLQKGRQMLLEIAEHGRNTGTHKYIGVGKFFNTETDVCFDVCDISSVSITKIEEKEKTEKIPLFD